MKFNRRLLIKWSTLFAPAIYSGQLFKQGYAKPTFSSIEYNALRVYIDLLIPADEMPGALDVAADQFILQKINTDAVYGKAVWKGVYWLNYLAHKLKYQDFSSLPYSSQIKIVTLSEQSPMATLPNLFYLMIRDDVFKYYYSHPEVLKHFYYAKPPQPLGFMDFSVEPVK